MEPIPNSMERSRRRGWAAVLCCLLCLAFACAGLGQNGPQTRTEATYVPTLTFDVTSVRENKAVWPFETGSANPEHASKFTAKNLTVQFLVEWAYEVEAHRIVGAPVWFNRSTFWIEAKGDAAAEEELTKLNNQQAYAEKLHMMRALLEDRFKLKAHWETRELPVYALVVAKGGAKLGEAGSMPPTSEQIKDYGEGKVPTLVQELKGHQGDEFYGHGCSMARLVQMLSEFMGRKVIDQTGLTGTYDFTLRYNGGQPTEMNQDPTIWPALLDAVPDQLGLRLEPTKGPVEVLVIDHLEKPSEN